MNKDGKVSFLFLIIVLSIVGIIIYFLISESLHPDNIREEENTNMEETTKEEVDIDDWKKLEEFPSNDKSVQTLMLRYQANESDICDASLCEDISIYENTKNHKVLNDMMDITFDCTNELSKDECGNISFNIDNKIKYLNTKFDIDNIANSHLIMKTDKYYIIKEIGNQYGEGIIYIYNNKGELIQTLEETVTEFNIINGNKIDYNNTYTYLPVINDNWLYYVKRSGEFNFSNGLESEVKFTRVKLDNNLKYDNLYTLKAITYELP